MGGLRLVDADTVNNLTEEDLNDFPEDSLRFMRESLGKNADGLTKVQLMERFLNTTDALLQNNLRYDVPAYIFNFPRNTYGAQLYINSMVIPIESGEVTEFYEINFKLHVVTGEDNLNELYDAISFVYDGIVLNENCEITLPGGMTNENIDIEEPIILEENKKLPLKPRFIQGKCFEPYESWLLPGTIHMQGTKDGDIVRASGCCRYRIEETEKQRNDRGEILNG